jgi:microcystin-dependent protein
LYVNFTDKRIGVIDENGDPIDLNGVRYFSALGQYFLNDIVINPLDNIMYQCIVANGPGAFNSSDWTTTADSFEKRLLGYGFEGLHEPITGDLDLILKNSLYTVESVNVVNAPAAFVGTGFIETTMWTTNIRGKQTLTALTTTDAKQRWTRVLSGGLWGAWNIDSGGASLGSVVEFPGLTTIPAGLGVVQAAGQTLLRADYPSFWDFLQTNAALIDDATWVAASNGGANGVGQYSDGDGVTDFRMVDLRGEFLRAMNSGGGGSNGRDPDRGNSSLDWQDGEFESHDHNINDPGHNHQFTAQQNIGGFTDNGGAPDQRSTAQSTTTDNRVTGISINNRGGSETRPRNIPVLLGIQVA